MENAIKIDGLPKNLDFTNTVTKCNNKYAHEERGKEIKRIFNEDKDWDKNLKKRRLIVKEVVTWHNNASIMTTYKDGKHKWLDKYMICEKELYTMRNILYMDRITTACTTYKDEHIEHLQEEEEEESGSEDDG